MKESTEQTLQLIIWIELFYVFALAALGIYLIGYGFNEDQFGIASIGGIFLALSMSCYCARLLILREGETPLAVICFIIQLLACCLSGITILIQWNMEWFSILGILLTPFIFIGVVVINFIPRFILSGIRMSLVAKDHFGQ